MIDVHRFLLRPTRSPTFQRQAQILNVLQTGDNEHTLYKISQIHFFKNFFQYRFNRRYFFLSALSALLIHNLLKQFMIIKQSNIYNDFYGILSRGLLI